LLAHERLSSAAGGKFSALAERVRCSYTVSTLPTKTRIVRIGNSRGIRIPRTLLEEADLPDEVELHAQPGRLVVQAARRPRSGWAAAAKRMRARRDDVLLDESTATKFDREEWRWP
jgi:antitoxin MazE